MISELYRKTLYLDKDIEFMFGRRICEYDIKSAGFNIIRHFKFLPESEIEFLASLPKHERHVAIGKLQQGNPELTKKMKLGFMACRKKLFQENNIQDEDVLSIKKDAIFIIDRRLEHTDFDTIQFVEKNVYDSYIYLNKIEFYMNDDECDCKGIKDELAALHRKYMLDIFREFGQLVRFSTPRKQIDFMTEVAEAYRTYQLNINYYRELNKRSLFRPKEEINVLSYPMGYNFYGGDPHELDISYNYVNYLIPMFRFLT